MSLKLPICNKDDLVEAIKLQKRALYEDERKIRIFNAKQRLFGIDQEALKCQILEKNIQRQTQLERDRRYEQQERLQKDLIREKELENEQLRRVENLNLIIYRDRHQRKEMRREYDLNDPNWLKKIKPIRKADEDIALGISSAQIFYGEDLDNRQRMKRQHQQQRAWLDQQVQERQQAEEARRSAELIYMNSFKCREQKLEETSKSLDILRDQRARNIHRYNLSMSKQKQLDRERAKKAQNEDDLAEIYNMLSSPLLAEKRARGMSEEELLKYRKDTEQQLIDDRQRRADEKVLDQQWSQFALNQEQEILKKQCEMDRQRNTQLEELMQTNSKLADVQNWQRKQEKLLKINVISDEFYDQFNKNSR